MGRLRLDLQNQHFHEVGFKARIHTLALRKQDLTFLVEAFYGSVVEGVYEIFTGGVLKEIRIFLERI